MAVLKIKTIGGKEFEVSGNITARNTPNGRIYYCGGGSFPESIVVGIKNTKPENKQISCKK